MSVNGFFCSCLAERFSAYVALRRNLGYEFRSQVYFLRQFDQVVAREIKAPGPVPREVVAAYLRSLSRLQPTTRRVRLSLVRQFLLFLRQFEPATYIPERMDDPGHGTPRSPYIFTDNEIRGLVQAAYRYPPRYGCRQWVLYPTLFGLLYVTGMRVSEALALTLRDVDLQEAVVRIRKTKFHKSRLIPLANSTRDAIRRYLVARAHRAHSTEADAPLFVNDDGKRLPYRTVQQAFHVSARMADINGNGCGRRPRVHDLRHTAAVRRLHLWYREGKDVQALLPVLVTYLGHSSVSSTAVYLASTGELLSEASARFEQAFDHLTDPDNGGAQ
jgi:site-specific recombinase XerD